MNYKYPNLGGAILAGGKSKRMDGINKAFINVEGQPIIHRIMHLYDALFEDIIIVTNTIDDFSDFKNNCILVSDILKNFGPLGGIHSALQHTNKRALFFVACDMPNLHNALMEAMLDRFHLLDCDALVPRIGSAIEPLHSIFSKKLIKDIEIFLKTDKKHSIQNFLQTINVEYFDLENSMTNKKIFNNLNTIEDVAREKRRG